MASATSGAVMLRSLAAFCYRRRRLVLGVWIVALVGVSVLGKAEGGELAKTFNLPGSESQHAFDVLKQNFSGGDQGQRLGLDVQPGAGHGRRQRPELQVGMRRLLRVEGIRGGSPQSCPWRLNVSGGAPTSSSPSKRTLLSDPCAATG